MLAFCVRHIRRLVRAGPVFPGIVGFGLGVALERRAFRIAAVLCVTLGAWLTGTGTAAASGWSILPVSAPAASASLTSVSCTSVSACTAVGGFTTVPGNASTPLVERWDGSSWTVQQ